MKAVHIKPACHWVQTRVHASLAISFFIVCTNVVADVFALTEPMRRFNGGLLIILKQLRRWAHHILANRW